MKNFCNISFRYIFHSFMLKVLFLPVCIFYTFFPVQVSFGTSVGLTVTDSETSVSDSDGNNGNDSNDDSGGSSSGGIETHYPKQDVIIPIEDTFIFQPDEKFNNQPNKSSAHDAKKQTALTVFLDHANKIGEYVAYVFSDPALRKSFHFSGVTAGTLSVIASLIIPFLENTPWMLRGGLMSFFGSLMNRDKKKKWGIVFDRDTKRPISGAIVSLFDEEKKRVSETQITDREGRYGFLSRQGLYSIHVKQGLYSMNFSESSDTLYGDLYQGNVISVHDVSQIIAENVALDPNGFDWKDFTRRVTGMYRSAIIVWLNRFLHVLFWGSFAYSAYIAYFSSNIVDLLIFLIHVLIALFLMFSQKAFGIVSDKLNSNPVPFAQIELFLKDKGMEQRMRFAISDTMGRYYLLAPTGKYTLKVRGETLDSRIFHKEKDVFLRDGILTQNIFV